MNNKYFIDRFAGCEKPPKKRQKNINLISPKNETIFKNIKPIKMKNYVKVLYRLSGGGYRNYLLNLGYKIEVIE